MEKLHKKLNLGMISLIPKLGPKVNINKYRPISLLPSTYKVISKTLANRVQPHLPQWIRPNQTSFVKNRFILDNVFTAFESMELAKETQQDLVILLLDMEKAYDKINWSFLQDTMCSMGFNKEWIK